MVSYNILHTDEGIVFCFCFVLFSLGLLCFVFLLSLVTEGLITKCIYDVII